MAASRGPVPKRSSQRRRVNKPEVEVTKAVSAPKVPVPRADRSWHPVAKRWFESLAKSGQSVYYEPSDWGTAWAIAESMSREFKPQPMTVGSGEHAHVEMVSLPPKAASLAAWLKGVSSLMATEGDRRRMRLELERPQEGEVAADVSELNEYRRRLHPSG